MTARNPFMPTYGTNQVLTPAAASASVALRRGIRQLRFVNTGANICYIRISNSTSGAQPATAADLPIAANNFMTIITKADDDDTLAHISALGTTLQVMQGEGGV